MTHPNISPGNLAHSSEIQEFLATGRITKCPPGKAVDTEVFIAKFKPNLERRLNIYRTEGSR